MTHTFFELFAGAGGMSLGLETAGWHCAGHAEIEKFPRAVLAHRWPDTPLLGDVTQLTGEQIGPVTLLSGGSPCQDLSIAGKRAGMTDGSGTRSSLFFEQMRLWHESHAPYCLWENVLGAFSSNHGRDFAAVLSAFIGTDLLADAAIHPDRTGKFRWKGAGVASGPTGVAAWRVLDAQYFGVPQSRRRVFVLGTRTGGVDPAEVLALSESVCGDSQTRRTTRQGTPDATPRRTYAIRGTIAAGRCAESGQQYGRYKDAPRVASTLRAQDHESHVVVTNAMNGLKSRSAQTAADGFITPSAGRPRRPTPLECERLMGWPDHHTLVPGASDSGRYKACGNGIASPVAAWIGLRLREALAHHSSTPEALA